MRCSVDGTKIGLEEWKHVQSGFASQDGRARVNARVNVHNRGLETRHEMEREVAGGWGGGGAKGASGK